MSRMRVVWLGIVAVLLIGLLISGCSGGSIASEEQGAGSANSEEVADSSKETEPEVVPKDYGVPAEDANLVNPMAADEASLQRGEMIYKTYCQICHGREGRGDGPVAVGLDPKPVDYRAEHVKALSDGELFYIITNGIEGSDMLAHGYIEEERRWHLVNYLRTLQE